MLFAIITVVWLCAVIWFLWDGDADAAGVTFLFGGFVWGLVFVIVLPFAAVRNVEQYRTAIDNDSIHKYDVEETEDDIIVYTDPDGVSHAISEDYFTNGESEAYVVRRCAENIGWVNLWAWDECDTELVGNIN